MFVYLLCAYCGTYMWPAESSQELVLSFQLPMDSRDQTQIIRIVHQDFACWAILPVAFSFFETVLTV